VKILLLNDNPVVNKLVTLSAQKTSDEVDIASNIDGVASQKYDLIIVDDSIYNDELLDELEKKVKYKKSLFICAKDAQEIESFSSILKKPFLPTDLVELFTMFEKEVQNEGDEEEQIFNDLDELNLESEEHIGESVLDDDEAQKVKDLLDENEEELNFDEEVQNDIESLELDELDELNLDELEEQNSDDTVAQEEDLLADYDLALDLEDEADVDISEANIEDEEVEDEEVEDLETATEEELEDEVDEAATEELNIEDSALDIVPDEFNLEEEPEEIEEEPEAIVEPEEEPEEIEEPEEEVAEAVVEESEEMNLEDEIQNAVENLTPEELESELDEDTLLKIATNEIDPLADLTSKDLKIALGEEVEREEAEEEVTDTETELEDIDTPAVAELEDIKENKEDNSGVKALKKLLEALNNKEVAASMKGMKISINITLGDN